MARDMIKARKEITALIIEYLLALLSRAFEAAIELRTPEIARAADDMITDRKAPIKIDRL